MEKSADAFRTISEVANDLKLPQHVLRFWETRFPQIRPLKRGGNRRFYRPDDVELLLTIKTLLYGEGFTIKGVQRLLKERGPRATAAMAKSNGERGARFPTTGKAPSGTAGEATDMPASADDTSGTEALDGADDGQPISPDLAQKLQMILFEVSECRRILAAVRE